MINYYEHIYQAAKEQNFEKLQAALVESSIDVWKSGEFYFSAVSQCIFEGDEEAVKFLQNNGAQLIYVATGLVKAGKLAEVNNLLMQGDVNTNLVAYYAQICGYSAYAEKLINHGATISYITQLAEDFKSINLADFEKPDIELEKFVIFAALSGHMKEVRALINRDANIIVDGALGALAEGGHFVKVEELEKRDTNITAAAMGFTRGGFFSDIDTRLVEKLVQEGAHISFLAEGAILAGHIKLAQRLLTGIDAGPNPYASHFSIPKKTASKYFSTLIPSDRTRYKEGGNYYSASTVNVILSALKSGYITADINSQLKFLSFFSHRHISSLVSKVHEHTVRFRVDSIIEQRSIAISNHMMLRNDSYPMALTRTEPGFQSMFYLLLQELVNKQVAVLQGKNPYQLFQPAEKYQTEVNNSSIDGYHDIIKSWK